MAYNVSPEQQAFFEDKGYLILRDVMSKEEAIDLQRWAQEVHDLPRTAETPWMPYEEINASGQRVLCRTENYANYHEQFNNLLRGKMMLSILGQLAKEDMLLFKEKSNSVPYVKHWNITADITILVNYKLAGSGGFSPHLDSTAYTHVKNIKHLTILMAVDASNMLNGGLEVVEGSHLMDIPIDRTDNCIEKSWVDSQKWVPVELETGANILYP